MFSNAAPKDARDGNGEHDREEGDPDAQRAEVVEHVQLLLEISHR